MQALFQTIRRRWLGSLGAIGFLGLGFCLGQVNTGLPLAAQPPQTIRPVNATTPATNTAVQAEMKRAVALIYGNMPISREEFGDYFIDLYGKERVDLFVNRRIIEIACAKKGIEVTKLEVEAQIAEDCKKIHVSQGDFVKNILKQRYNKTEDEWKQDVIKPRLMLAKLCRDRIQVSDEELRQMFENRHGKKVRCKIIIWPKDAKDPEAAFRHAQRDFAELRKGDTEFDAIATKQADSNLAAVAGIIEPIGRYSGSQSAKMEEIAFGLQAGQVSAIQELSIGYVVVKCVGHIDPEKVELEKVKNELYKEVVDRRLELEIPKLFAEMKKEADPQIFLPR